MKLRVNDTLSENLVMENLLFHEENKTVRIQLVHDFKSIAILGNFDSKVTAFSVFDFSSWFFANDRFLAIVHNRVICKRYTDLYKSHIKVLKGLQNALTTKYAQVVAHNINQGKFLKFLWTILPRLKAH